MRYLILFFLLFFIFLFFFFHYFHFSTSKSKTEGEKIQTFDIGELRRDSFVILFLLNVEMTLILLYFFFLFGSIKYFLSGDLEIEEV